MVTASWCTQAITSTRCNGSLWKYCQQVAFRQLVGQAADKNVSRILVLRVPWRFIWYPSCCLPCSYLLKILDLRQWIHNWGIRHERRLSGSPVTCNSSTVNPHCCDNNSDGAFSLELFYSKFDENALNNIKLMYFFTYERDIYFSKR